MKIPTHTEDGVAVRLRCKALKSFLDESDWRAGQVGEVIASRAMELERRGLVQILLPPAPKPEPAPVSVEPEPIVEAPPAVEPEPAPVPDNVCSECGKTFKSAAGVQSHRRRVH